jgi:hypothetical protein
MPRQPGTLLYQQHDRTIVVVRGHDAFPAWEFDWCIRGDDVRSLHIVGDSLLETPLRTSRGRGRALIVSIQKCNLSES